MNMIAVVALGGSLGSVGRYLFASLIGRWFGTAFPFGTLAVNVLGSFIMGVLVEAWAIRWNVGPEWRAFLTVGFLGGFTTFSAFSLDTVLLLERGSLLTGLSYVVGSLVLSIGALYAALRITRVIIL